MKLLTIVIHACSQQQLADSLRAIPQVQGFTFTHVEGHSEHSEADPFLSARDKVVGYVPRVRVDILITEQTVDLVLDALSKEPSFHELGIYWVSPVERYGRL